MILILFHSFIFSSAKSITWTSLPEGHTQPNRILCMSLSFVMENSSAQAKQYLEWPRDSARLASHFEAVLFRSIVF